jgi:heme/copper-type cytochrome/quinol oxidase subunit 3
MSTSESREWRAWTWEPRPDTRLTNVQLAIGLFLASEAMLFGSFLFACGVLRAGADAWSASQWVNGTAMALASVALIGATPASERSARRVIVAGTVFLAITAGDMIRLLHSGRHPADDVALACWFVVAGLHWIHTAGGVAAIVCHAAAARTLDPRHAAERLRALRWYWGLLDLIWLGLLAAVFRP